MSDLQNEMRDSLEDIARSIVEEYSGRSQEKIIGRPDRHIFLGQLIPPDEDQRMSISETRASSIGLDIDFSTPVSEIVFDIIVKFSIYKRGVPTFSDQRTWVESGEVNLAEIFLKENFEKAYKIKIDITKNSELEIDQFNTDFQEFITQAIAKVDTLTRKSRTNPDTSSENSYLNSLSNLDGPRLGSPFAAKLKIHVKQIEDNVAKFVITLNNEASSSKVLGHDPRLYDPEIKISTSIEFQDAVGMGCVANILTKQSVIGEHTPILIQKRQEPLWTIGDHLTFKKLSENPENGLLEFSEKLCTFAASLPETPPNGIDSAKFFPTIDDLDFFQNEIKAGVNILLKDNEAKEAFKLLNEAMKIAMGENGRWYRYQLGFIIAGFNQVKNKNSSYVMVLNVPTGGGKTYAYLGLILFLTIYERLKGRKSGVTGWIKFPLRMLSIQQLEIVTKLVSAVYIACKDKKVPGDPISVGYLVGKRAGTPNKYEDAKDKIVAKDDFRIVTNCTLPKCNGEVELISDDDKKLTFHKCLKCGEYLPIYCVDYEIYRVKPSIIISTLDKVVSAYTCNWRSISLLGGKSGRCVNNLGHIVGNICPDSMGNQDCQFIEKGFLCKLDKTDEDGPPTIIAQDEMHLLRTDWGCIDSLIETTIDNVCKDLTKKQPIYVGATATVTGINWQVKNLYGRDVARRIPPNLIRIGMQNGYFFEETNNIHRIILGILPRERALKWGVQSLLRAIHQRTQVHSNNIKLYNNLSTIVGYYRSKREANEIPSVIDQINEQGNMGGAPIDPKRVKVVTGEMTLNELRKLIYNLKDGDIRHRYSLLATTMIFSHGIDFPLLNSIVFQGVPRSVSEYIQAMSRVGREYPSLVVVVFHGSRARDLSYYKYFLKWHTTLDDFIEEVPIYRWQSNAIRKVTPASALIYLNTILSQEAEQSIQKASNYIYLSNRGIITKAMLIEKIKNGFCLTQTDSIGYEEKYALDIESAVNSLDAGIMNASRTELLFKIAQTTFPGSPITSMRLIDKSVGIVPSTNTVEHLPFLKCVTMPESSPVDDEVGEPDENNSEPEVVE